MSWGSYWLPHLIDWVVGGSATTLVGLLLRRLLRDLRDAQHATVIAARLSAQTAHSAAKEAAGARTGTDDVLGRLRAVEGAVGGMRDAVSASLGHRALDALRFDAIERQLLETRTRGRHAGSEDSP